MLSCDRVAHGETFGTSLLPGAADTPSPAGVALSGHAGTDSCCRSCTLSYNRNSNTVRACDGDRNVPVLVQRTAAVLVAVDNIVDIVAAVAAVAVVLNLCTVLGIACCRAGCLAAGSRNTPLGVGGTRIAVGRLPLRLLGTACRAAAFAGTPAKGACPAAGGCSEEACPAAGALTGEAPVPVWGALHRSPQSGGASRTGSRFGRRAAPMPGRRCPRRRSRVVQPARTRARCCSGSP